MAHAVRSVHKSASITRSTKTTIRLDMPADSASWQGHLHGTRNANPRGSEQAP